MFSQPCNRVGKEKSMKMEKEYGKVYEIRPYGMKVDLNEHEDTYSNVVYHKGKNETVFSSTLAYPYAFVFHNDDDYVFVFHALIHFDNLDNILVRESTMNGIYAMDKIALKINTMKGKKVLVKALKEVLEENMARGIYRLEEQKCIEHINWYLDKYEKASFDCAKLKILPVHMNLRSDLHGVLNQFLPGDPHKHVDAKMEENINKTFNHHNVETKDGVEIELDRFITMTVDPHPEVTVHKDKIGEKTYHEIISEKEIGIYDLYTFVIEEFDFTTGTKDYEYYNFFWDGDVEEFDESTENLDKILLSSELGFQDFVKIMSRNKFIPNGMYTKLMEEINEHTRKVVGAYKVDIRNVVDVNYGLVDEPPLTV